MSHSEQTSDIINRLSHSTTAGFISEAQRLADGGTPVVLATGIVLDAALMAAASFIQTAVFNGAVRTTMPIPELLHTRLGELLAMETKVFSRRPDGSFDPVGLTRQ